MDSRLNRCAVNGNRDPNGAESPMHTGNVNHGRAARPGLRPRHRRPSPGRRYNVIVVAFRLSRSLAGVKSG